MKDWLCSVQCERDLNLREKVGQGEIVGEERERKGENRVIRGVG